MPGSRQLLLTSVFTLAMACSSDNAGSDNGKAKVLTAIVNGAAFSATTVSAGYLDGNLTVGGFTGLKNLSINATNLTGPGTYSFNVGNQWSALAEWIDGDVGSFSSGYGGVGTLTLTTATLSRVTGTFSFTAYTSAGTGAGKPVVTVLSGVIDVTSP
jgi:hypothetical protein